MATHIRVATDTDHEALASIEAAADAVFGETGWDAPPSGASRLDDPGFILVASESQGGDAVGFAHVIEHEGGAHLEQVSVAPEFGQRGHGRELVCAAIAQAAQRGHSRMTLRTFADVPWNAPFYASLGFREAPTPDELFHEQLAAIEAALGLEAFGRRVHMELPLA